MGLPNQAITLNPAEVAELDQKLGDLRHNVNNHLTLIVTALELIRRKPESAERMAANLVDQPSKIRADLSQFTEEFEKALQITRE